MRQIPSIPACFITLSYANVGDTKQGKPSRHIISRRPSGFKGLSAPILWDVRSLWSDQRKLIGTAGWNPLTARAARTLENVSAKNATAMTTLTAAVVPILEKRHRKLPKIRAVVPTCVQTKKFLMTTSPTCNS